MPFFNLLGTKLLVSTIHCSRSVSDQHKSRVRMIAPRAVTQSLCAVGSRFARPRQPAVAAAHHLPFPSGARVSSGISRRYLAAATLCHAGGAAVGMAIAADGAAEADRGGDSPLWRRIVSVYHTALDNGDVFKTETDDKVFTDPMLHAGFVLRMAASLNSKPRPREANSSGGGGKPFNPFLPYDEALWVAHLSDSHTCLLNKFNVVAYHALVVTRAFEEQTSPLTATDFDATLAVLQAMPHGGVAYFNCGPESGASQPHKHLQVVPLPLMAGLPASLPLQGLLDAATEGSGGAMVELRQLPYQALAARLGPDRLTGQQLEPLAAQMLAACRQRNGGGADPSYNVVLTCKYLQMIPRCSEASGPVSVNALGPAGTMFVKNREQLQYIERESPGKVLADIGFPW